MRKDTLYPFSPEHKPVGAIRVHGHILVIQLLTIYNGLD